jgi:DNA polymerase-3 subunit chi
MQVDFYHLTRDPSVRLIPVLAQKTLNAGQRLVIVEADPVNRERLSEALWQHRPESFLAHDSADSDYAAQQPIILSAQCSNANHARFIALADGQWHDAALTFDRIFYLFTARDIDTARGNWRALSGRADVSCKYWKQEGGRWQAGP